MRTLVLYTSNTGNTKRYAERIAEGIGADILPFNKRMFKKMSLKDYDTIVYGGWLSGMTIQGVNEFLARWDDMSEKNVLIYAVGMGVVSKESRDNLINSNLLDLYHLRFYQLRGSFDYSKLKFPYTWMIRLGIKGAIQRNDPGTDAETLGRLIETPLEYDDNDGVDRVLSVLHRLASESKE